MKKILIFLIMVSAAISVLATDLFRGVEQPEFLTVISAPAGSFDGESLSLEGVSTAVYFSDRPERIAGHMTVSDFVALWDEGEDSFSADPPNATLSILGDEEVTDVVLVLTNADILAGIVTFEVDILEGELPAEFGIASLFIDAFPTAVNSQITD
jgi:hypothetical protein